MYFLFVPTSVKWVWPLNRARIKTPTLLHNSQAACLKPYSETSGRPPTPCGRQPSAPTWLGRTDRVCGPGRFFGFGVPYTGLLFCYYLVRGGAISRGHVSDPLGGAAANLQTGPRGSARAVRAPARRRPPPSLAGVCAVGILGEEDRTWGRGRVPPSSLRRGLCDVYCNATGGGDPHKNRPPGWRPHDEDRGDPHQAK